MVILAAPIIYIGYNPLASISSSIVLHAVVYSGTEFTITGFLTINTIGLKREKTHTHSENTIQEMDWSSEKTPLNSPKF